MFKGCRNILSEIWRDSPSLLGPVSNEIFKAAMNSVPWQAIVFVTVNNYHCSLKTGASNGTTLYVKSRQLAFII
jgi:hypothetical protein